MIEFIGKFDENVTKNLNTHFYKKHWWLYVLCSVAFILFGVFGIFVREDNSDLALAIFLIVFGVLFTPITMLLTSVLQKNMNKSMHILSSDTVETYQFYPDKLVITQKKGDEFEAVTTTRYSYFYSIEETTDRYFLRISKSQSHVVNKADLTQGSIPELNVILHANLGEKFKSLK